MILSTPPAYHRFHLLDALRGIAAILIVFWYGRFYFATPPGSHNWPLAVDFFFCLSGFVISFAYEQRLRQGFGMRNLFQLYRVGNWLIASRFPGSSPLLLPCTVIAIASFAVAKRIDFPLRRLLLAKFGPFPSNGPTTSCKVFLSGVMIVMQT